MCCTSCCNITNPSSKSRTVRTNRIQAKLVVLNVLWWLHLLLWLISLKSSTLFAIPHRQTTLQIYFEKIREATKNIQPKLLTDQMCMAVQFLINSWRWLLLPKQNAWTKCIVISAWVGLNKITGSLNSKCTLIKYYLKYCGLYANLCGLKCMQFYKKHLYYYVERLLIISSRCCCCCSNSRWHFSFFRYPHISLSHFI